VVLFQIYSCHTKRKRENEPERAPSLSSLAIWYRWGTLVQQVMGLSFKEEV